MIQLSVSTGLVHKKGNPLLAAIFKYFLGVISFFVYIFVKYRYFNVNGEIMGKMEEMGKVARINLLRLFEHN